jgi:1-acyl-sn-glycerol-3-phosphate acyltransferase
MRWSLNPLYKAHENKELCKKFAPFIRNDLGSINLLRFPLFLTFWPRHILTWLTILIGAINLVIMTIGADPTNLSKTRWWIFRKYIEVNTGFIIKLTGFARTERIEVPVDYSKYLGPDWKPKYEGAPTLVGNHRSWIDIMVNLHVFCPAFLARAGAKNVPGIGKCS